MKIQRRTLLQGGLAAATQFLVGCGNAAQTDAPLVGFTPVPFAKGVGPMPTISDDYVYEALIPWGTPLQPDGPAYQHPATSDQAEQVGIGHDGMTFFPISDDGKRGLLAINHEYGRNTHVLGKAVPESLADVQASQYAMAQVLSKLLKSTVSGSELRAILRGVFMVMQKQLSAVQRHRALTLRTRPIIPTEVPSPIARMVRRPGILISPAKRISICILLLRVSSHRMNPSSATVLIRWVLGTAGIYSTSVLICPTLALRTK